MKAFILVLLALFFYAIEGVPVITGINPSPFKCAGARVTLTGTGFTGSPAVGIWDNTLPVFNTAIVSGSSTQIVFDSYTLYPRAWIIMMADDGGSDSTTAWCVVPTPSRGDNAGIPENGHTYTTLSTTSGGDVTFYGTGMGNSAQPWAWKAVWSGGSQTALSASSTSVTFRFTGVAYRSVREYDIKWVDAVTVYHPVATEHTYWSSVAVIFDRIGTGAPVPYQEVYDHTTTFTGPGAASPVSASFRFARWGRTVTVTMRSGSIDMGTYSGSPGVVESDSGNPFPLRFRPKQAQRPIAHVSNGGTYVDTHCDFGTNGRIYFYSGPAANPFSAAAVVYSVTTSWNIDNDAV